MWLQEDVLYFISMQYFLRLLPYIYLICLTADYIQIWNMFWVISLLSQSVRRAAGITVSFLSEKVDTEESAVKSKRYCFILFLLWWCVPVAEPEALSLRYRSLKSTPVYLKPPYKIKRLTGGDERPWNSSRPRLPRLHIIIPQTHWRLNLWMDERTKWWKRDEKMNS